MATYREIQDIVQSHHGFVPKPGSIAHVRVLRGLPVRRKANRAAGAVASCPPEKREAIEQAEGVSERITNPLDK